MTSKPVQQSWQVLVIGCGGHARFVLSMISYSHFSTVGLIDLREDFDPDETIMGSPIIGCLSQLPQWRERFNKVVLAIGDNERRMTMYRRVVELNFELPNIVYPGSFIDTSCAMGHGNIVGPGVVLGAEVTIGNDNIINSGAVIEHQSQIGNHCHVAPNVTICGNVVVQDKVLLGAGSTILPQVEVATGTTLGAGSILLQTQNEPGKTLLGSPARVLNK